MKKLSQREILKSVRKPATPPTKVIKPKKGGKYDRNKEKQDRGKVWTAFAHYSGYW